MKISRHAKILEIINSKDIETQEELADELRKQDMVVTQATVSRDIKELKLIKVLSNNGKYKYASISSNENFLSNKLVSVFIQTVLNVEHVKNFVVVKTISGSAPGAAEAIDSLNFDEIAGTIAGDNTIFILVRSEEKAFEIVQKLKKLLNENE
ncbi:arginine repressor [Clostridium pasteurianum DSM 525 = ATCC 6013]|uniref:Arginine repressor n=1 Tax=Clostridium pasteurianum DSM 525 = ATCC 6013 TaxID=1262449 RepID=A0A0H3J9U5_CLOPA|nr:arginine repressor [Clostridium pasteurianum]AJA47985.1 arginine repressor [Clostridium pasteurianum DSM 525 = ATCC 6013]AJA51973.1 arginine repressor [Clostridium pasteurianum DSM 525 = ATCC 6013]AOZ75270.1 ArgR family transcriptional regulator [Clostridium pasteurianum DSM 525 = ATCC 6013]AOZ79065.1 ArgR family transcriptional regulator [Clostridium pasteurianum]ELP59888.1 arginine repressor [Clostridium pasteurianum DSM 525 = ATCC 6013]